jgi:hypothetical protein
MFAVLKNLDDVNIKRVWESIRVNMKVSATECLGYYELK